MRTEKEMFDLILNIAKKDDRIRAVYMNGSRTNKNVNKDIFQDYDIVFVVEDIRPFIKNKKWINVFGEILYMQYPDDNSYEPEDPDNQYGWLMLFSDGNRIDLTMVSIKRSMIHIHEDKLCVVLLDKDNLLPQIPESTDEDYWIKKPSERLYLGACNNYWWCLNNVAKGIWREEVTYVMDMLNYVLRPELFKILSWNVGFDTDFKVSMGKSGKYMYKWIDKNKWENYLKTYPSGNIEDIKYSVNIMCELFNDAAVELSKKMNVKYNEEEAKVAMSYLNYVINLPKNAKEVF